MFWKILNHKHINNLHITRNSIPFLNRTRLRGRTQLVQVTRTYQTAENKAYTILLRGLPPEITAEAALRELKRLEYPVIHVRWLRRKAYNKNLQQGNSLFLAQYVNAYIVEQNTRNIRQLIGLFNFKAHIEDYTGLSDPFQWPPQNLSNAEETTFPANAKNLKKTLVNVQTVRNNIRATS
jgi:hypothetical protein